jgi:hypothetical protein
VKDAVSDPMPSTRRFPRTLSVTWFAVVAGAACGHRAPMAGDPCAGPARVRGGYCLDAEHVLTCRAFTWHVDACRGPRGCAALQCDQSVAEEGDTCGNNGALACSPGRRELLRCTGSTMAIAQTCRGDRGCYRETPDSDPLCDVGPAEVGDACEVEGARCGVDGKSVIGCGPTSRHYALQKSCKGPKGCFQFSAFATAEQQREKDHCSIGAVACDVSVGDVGEPCGGYPEWGKPCLPGDHCPAGATRTESNTYDGWKFCSSDGKEELDCKSGTLVHFRRCASCTVTWAENEAHYSVACKPDAWSQGGGAVSIYQPEHS